MEIAKVVIIGIVLVFLILVLLTFVLVLFGRITGIRIKSSDKGSDKRSDKDNSLQAEGLPTCEAPGQTGYKETADDLSLICAISAAIAAFRESEGESGGFRVVAFRKTPRSHERLRTSRADAL